MDTRPLRLALENIAVTAVEFSIDVSSRTRHSTVQVQFTLFKGDENTRAIAVAPGLIIERLLDVIDQLQGQTHGQ